MSHKIWFTTERKQCDVVNEIYRWNATPIGRIEREREKRGVISCKAHKL